ncbi:DoxX family protein [Acidisphaera sp. L21]|uniref:DoxX family protein n=1 Tax=Acidisphaera sp. L21 TaxID=1641851 RepID=UPI001C206B64|nr:DoxX family protein [Acidisphaera sp. L21]
MERGRTVARYALATIYVAAGVFHLGTPDVFVAITPGWVPFPRLVILVTGLCELAGASGLLLPRRPTSRSPLRWARPAAGIGLALYAVCVYPANIKHAMYGLPGAQMQLGWWYHAPRLAFQPVLVWWALFAGEVTSWPFRRAKRPDA